MQQTPVVRRPTVRAAAARPSVRATAAPANRNNEETRARARGGNRPTVQTGQAAPSGPRGRVRAVGGVRGRVRVNQKALPPKAAWPDAPFETHQTKGEASLQCKLLTAEAPRGGELRVSGKGFGESPLVRINGKVARILSHNRAGIRVQVHKDSDGGLVTVHAAGKQAKCGTLEIMGRN